MASSKNVTDPTGPPPGVSHNPDGCPKGVPRKKLTCPNCGRGYGNLPNHLRSCLAKSEADGDGGGDGE